MKFIHIKKPIKTTTGLGVEEVITIRGNLLKECKAFLETTPMTLGRLGHCFELLNEINKELDAEDEL